MTHPRPSDFPACGECGAALRHASEFHPYAFCQMKKRGLDPWAEMRKRYPKKLTSRPPTIAEKSQEFIDVLVEKAERTEKATR